MCLLLVIKIPQNMAIDDLKVVMIKKELTLLGVRLPSGPFRQRTLC